LNTDSPIFLSGDADVFPRITHTHPGDEGYFFTNQRRSRIMTTFTVPKLAWISLLAALYLVAGCSAMLPRGKERTISPWRSFDDAKHAYDGIVPHHTRRDDLKVLGFEPDANKNVRILNHLEVLDRFLPNKVLTRADLPAGMLDCIKVSESCHAYEINQRVTQTKRNGNFFSDFLNFSRKTETTGWEFNAVIVMNDDLVVYKLWSGKPRIEAYQENTNPLGPLQGSGPGIVTPSF
jgi:hypothetical protein